MRDFYPEEMRLQNWLFDTWRDVSRAFGFAEYDGPIFEYLDLYTLKSGDAIVSELFNFQDRGGRAFAIRPEMTPTLARMVAAKANALSRPIKWFSIPRLCRAEKPQRGRLREFFQWNVDTLGQDDMLADAEVIACLVEFYRRLGVTPAEVEIRLNSRPLAASVLIGAGVPAAHIERAFVLIDKYDAADPEEFRKRWAADEALAAAAPAAVVEPLLGAPFDQCAELARLGSAPGTASGGRGVEGGPLDAVGQIGELLKQLSAFGVLPYCRFDMTIVRGLAYYTGPVFEASARKVGLRALAGGGRYDNLTELLDGPRLTGVGFGMGDAPNTEFLREIGKLATPAEAIDVFAIDADERLFTEMLGVVSQLRRSGVRADFSFKRSGLGKQLKAASVRGAEFALIVGAEYTQSGELGLKHLPTGRQSSVSGQELLIDPQRVLAAGRSG